MAILRQIRILTIFLFLLDGGNGLGLQYFMFLIVVATGLELTNFSHKSVIFALCAIISIVMPVFLSVTRGANFDVFIWCAVPILLMICIGLNISLVSFTELIYASNIFAIFIISIFIIKVIDHDQLTLIINFLIFKVEGFFNTKNAWGFEQPVVYFQNTLIFSVLYVVALSKKRYFSSLLYLTVLLCAPSRFGVFICLLLSLPFVRNIIAERFDILWPIASLFVALLFLSGLHSILLDNTREIALDGIREQLSSKTGNLLFGIGLNANYYDAFLDVHRSNYEIVGIEFIRKFGILSYFIYFSSFYFIVFRIPHNAHLRLVSLVSFILSLVNPILFSLSAMLIFSACIRRQCK